MTRLLGLLSLAALMSLASGCAMCCHPYDCHYLYQGGRWVRDVPDRGRVGSAFEEAGHRVDDVAETQPQQATPASPPANVAPNSNSRLVPQRTPATMPRNNAPYLPVE